MKTFDQWLENWLTKVYTPETSTSELGSVRARKGANRLGIETLADLSKWDMEEFMRSAKLGSYDLIVCREALHKAGLSFKNDSGPLSALN